jgi:hypothetical protein|tara:strand:- start:883 stop:1056 length:174 start_codon:yes stop_codon:yes gene_type:complete
MHFNTVHEIKEDGVLVAYTIPTSAEPLWVPLVQGNRQYDEITRRISENDATLTVVAA